MMARRTIPGTKYARKDRPLALPCVVINKIRSMFKRRHEGMQVVDLNATVNETLRLAANEARLRHVILRHVATWDGQSTRRDQNVPCTQDGMQVLEVRDNGSGDSSREVGHDFQALLREQTRRTRLGTDLSFDRRLIRQQNHCDRPPGCGACCNRLKSRNNLSAINMLRFSTEVPGRTYTFAYVPRSLATMTK